MSKENYNVIGVMSGTSLDGIDLAHIFLGFEAGKWTFEIKEAETVPYTESWVTKLKSALHLSEAELQELNTDYTELLGGIIRDFITRHQFGNLDAVCSHGHTIIHNPAEGYTLQIGNLPEIAALCGVTTVCDFRVQDVALGGQGAPLVPMGDRLLFSDFDYCLNLGGFSNISFEDGGKRTAFDISPVNTVLNHYANRLGFPFDDGGKIAESGVLDMELLAELDGLEYYKKPFPKSLGFEFVKDVIFPILEPAELSEATLLRTFTEHVARQIAFALPEKSGRMLATGGGAYNGFLISRIGELLPGLDITVPDAKTLEFKEALIFGLLGVLKLREEVNVLCSTTGAARNHVAGFVYHPY